MFALLWLSLGVPFKPLLMLVFQLLFRLVFWLRLGMRYRLSPMELYRRLYIDQLRA
jgi:hypothetical protein